MRSQAEGLLYAAATAAEQAESAESEADESKRSGLGVGGSLRVADGRE